MSEGLGMLTLVTELLLIIQCLQISFEQKIDFDKYTLGILVADICIYMGINYYAVPKITSVMFYVLLWGYCYQEFKLSVVNTTFKLVAGVALLGCIEVIIGYVTRVFVGRNQENYALFASSLFSLLFAIVLKRILVFGQRNKKSKRNMGMVGMISLYCLTMGGLLMDYYLNQGVISLYVVAILFFIVCIFGYLYRLKQAQNEIGRKNYELELQRVYGETYESLLGEVRRRQHDFKNQLGAIYSMHLTAQSLEELIEMQQCYGNTLNKNCKYDSIMTGCDNQILAGYLYYKCIACENEGIDVIFDICVEQATCSWAIHEMIELLGILIDNACESVLTEVQSNKCIRLAVREEKNSIVFAVSNPTGYIPYTEIEKMFECGYSRKGENRGIGLTRVRELVKKYQTEMLVHNNTCDNVNWIEFVIKIDK